VRKALEDRAMATVNKQQVVILMKPLKLCFSYQTLNMALQIFESLKALGESPAPEGGEESEKKEEEKKEEEKKEEAPKAAAAAAAAPQCAMKWAAVEKVGDKWHVPGDDKKEKDLQGAQYSNCNGVVALRGCLISEGGADTVAFVLPSKCAPKTALRFTAFTSNGKKTNPADVVVSPDGNVTVSSTDAGEFWFSGISYDI